MVDIYGSLAHIYEIQKKYFEAISYEDLCLKAENKLLSDYSYFLSANQLEQYLSTYNRYFERFNNYLYLHSKQFQNLSKISYDTELQIKQLILRRYNQVENAIINSNDSVLINTFEKFRASKIKLAKYYSQPLNYPLPDPNELEAYAERLEKKLIRISQFSNNYQQQFKPTWLDVQNKLKPNEAAVEFISFSYNSTNHWTDREVYDDSILYCALIIRPGYSQPKFVYLFEEKQMASIIKKEESSLDQPYINKLYQFKNNGNPLYQLIWQPLDSLLQGVTTIYAAPSGLLYKIALGAIPVSGDNTVLNKYNLHILGTTLDIINKKEDFIDKKSIQQAIVFGGINYDIAGSKPTDFTNIDSSNIYTYVPRDSTRAATGKWNYLVGSMKESEEITRQFNKQNIVTHFYSDSAATETLFKNMPVNSSSVIHIATHGYFFP